jgi:hypothetical protein
MGVEVYITGCKNETSSELEWVFAQLMLPVAVSLCTSTSSAIVGPQKMQ